MRVWQPAEVPFRATSTGLTTTIVSSPHASITNEPDDIFNNDGGYALARTGANAGGAYRIADFSTATGTLSLVGDPLGTASADGDLFLYREVIRVEADPTVTVNRKVLERRVMGNATRAADLPVPITAEGGIEFAEAHRPLTASAGGGTLATSPIGLGGRLRDFMTEQKDTGSTVSSGSAGTLTPAGGTFNTGGFVLLGTGEASQISLASGGVLTVPQMLQAPVTSSTVYASCWYQTKGDTFFTRTFDIFRGKLERQYLSGCAPSCEMKITRDQVISFNWKYQAAEAIEYVSGNPNSVSAHRFGLVDTGIPMDGKGARVFLNGVKVLVEEITINFGPNPLARPCLSGMNQYDGFAFDFQPVKLTMTGYLADNDDLTSAVDAHDMLETGAPVSFFYQKGASPKNTLCASIPALSLTKVEYGVNNAQGKFDIEGIAASPALTGASVLLPDFALGFI